MHFSHRSRTMAARTAAAAALALTLAGCGSEDSSTGVAEPAAPASSSAATSTPPASTTPSATPSASVAAGLVLPITVEGDKVRPNARELKLKVGEKLTLEFTADRAGELHVHSTPEQYVQFEAGKSTKTIVIKAPGKVEVEEHETGAVVALLEVR